MAVNPRGLIPAIKDGDFLLSESNAILKYIASTHSTVPAHYWPKDEQTRALTDQFLEYYQNHFRPAFVTPLRLKMGIKIMKVPYEEATYDAAMAALWKEAGILENYLGQHEGDFIVNNEPTIADLQIFYDFQNLIYIGLDKSWEENYPQITAWYDKILALPEVNGLNDQWLKLVSGFIALMSS